MRLLLDENISRRLAAYLRLHCADLVFLLTQLGFEQINVAPTGAASGQESQQQQWKSEPHP